MSRTTKHLIITGPQKEALETMARSILQVVPHKYTTRLSTKINEMYLARFQAIL